MINLLTLFKFLNIFVTLVKYLIKIFIHNMSWYSICLPNDNNNINNNMDYSSTDNLMSHFGLRTH